MPKEKRTQTVRRKRGRPEGVGNAREEILAAAGDLFASKGYAATSLREVAETSGVTTALVTYYFGSKDALLESIMMSYGAPLAEERRKNLEALQKSEQDPTVREIVLALLAPLVRIPRSPAARRFLKIQAWLHSEPDRFAYALRDKLYDQTNHDFVAALRKALPHLSAKTVYWRFMLSVGSYIYLAADTQRLIQLSGGVCDPANNDELLGQMADFVCGGLTAPDREENSSSSPSESNRVEATR